MVYRDSAELQVEIHFMRAGHKGSFLVVEGDTDFCLYRKFVIKSECEVIPAYGCEDKGAKDTILELITRMHRFKGIIGIVDSDFSKIDGELVEDPNVVMTDTHDVETLIIKSPALEQVFDVYVDRAKLKQFETTAGKNIVDILLTNAQYIGLFVWYNNKKKLYLNFKGIDFLKFIDKNSLSINIQRLIETVYDNSGKIPRNKEKILCDLKKMGNKDYDKWHLCRGHDLAEILYIGIKYIFGSYRIAHIDNYKGLERELIFAYDSIYFAKTNIYRSIKQWELTNSPFVICINELNRLTQ